MTGTAALAEAYAVGRAYEAQLDDRARELGAHYTPPDVAETLVGLALGEWHGHGAPVICDPACGGGAVLVAAAEALRRRGHDPQQVVEQLVVGVDLDPGAVAASVAALRRWAGDPSVVPRVAVGDALGDAPIVGPVDVVVGNPPFRSQLGASTSRSAEDRARLVERFGASAGGYVDDAAVFLLRSIDLVGAGGVVALLQPRSLLVARDASGVRDRVVASLRGVWLPGESLFAASVDVCAPVVIVGERSAEGVWVRSGRSAEVTHDDVAAGELAAAPTWSPVWASAHDVPRIAAQPGHGTIGDVATATAGFRDQYYGLLPHLRDAEPARGARVVTTAMIDPGRCDWSDRPVTIARQRRVAPWVDLDALAATAPGVAAWVERLATPKVLVATQTRVIEAVIDPTGDMVPMTPVIAVVPQEGIEPSIIEGALAAPEATAWALRRFGGAGLSNGALKLAARQVLEIPLPDAWHLGGDDTEALMTWWTERTSSSATRRRRPIH